MTALRTEVPTDHAGLICADSYRTRLADDPPPAPSPKCSSCSTRATCFGPRSPVRSPEKQYVESALRIIDGLTIHRLTTDDVNRPIGMTAEMLRDELCLSRLGLPERDALFLKTTVDSIVRKILTAVSGSSSPSTRRTARSTSTSPRTSTTTSRSSSGPSRSTSTSSTVRTTSRWSRSSA